MKMHSRRIVFALLAMVGLLIWAPSVGADVILSHNNSTVRIDPDTQAGVYEWVVDGQNMLYQQWFWYRIGSTGGEQSIDSISAPNVSTFQIGNEDRGVSLEYIGTGFTVETTYILTGGTIGFVSDLAEIIVIRNTSSEGAPLDFHFFQYSDFDLCGSQGDTVNVVSGSQVRQWDNGCSLSETVVSPAAGLWEAGEFADTRTSLNNGSPTTLNGISAFGPGDATWAYQWDVSLGPGRTFIISKDKSIQPIPEPATLTLLGVGAGLLGLSRKRRKA